MPVNNKERHWIAVKINIFHQGITSYDADNFMTCSYYQVCIAKYLLMLFAYLLPMIDVYNGQLDLIALDRSCILIAFSCG